MPLKLLRQFLRLESASSIVLFLAAVLALIWASSPWASLYQQLTSQFIFLINDVFMAVFFLLVGLELKRGFLEGQLSTYSQILLPALAALGGMLIPALIYLGFNYPNYMTMQAWATPVATDIAFALGTLALFGKRVPIALKLFLLALAIFDDIGAIIIIVAFYSHELSYLWLLQAGGLVVILYLLNRSYVRALLPYLLIGVCLWFCFWQAGIHPTIAGVILALAIPDKPSKKHLSPLRHLEGVLHPWVAYGIMPLFALANAGIALQNLALTSFTSNIVLGIACGLFFGKQIGVFIFSWGLIKLRFAQLPEKSSWLELYGVALLCGIGFTMSLFLGTLSFQHESAIYLTEVRLGVLLGSALSGLMGALILSMIYANKTN